MMRKGWNTGVGEQEQEEEEEEEEERRKASDWTPLQREREVSCLTFDPTEVIRGGELTAQDDVSRPQQLQTLQQVDELAHHTVPVPPLVHHPVGPPLPPLSQSHGGLISEHLRGCEYIYVQSVTWVKLQKKYLHKMYLKYKKWKYWVRRKRQKED